MSTTLTTPTLYCEKFQQSLHIDFGSACIDEAISKCFFLCNSQPKSINVTVIKLSTKVGLSIHFENSSETLEVLIPPKSSILCTLNWSPTYDMTIREIIAFKIDQKIPIQVIVNGKAGTGNMDGTNLTTASKMKSTSTKSVVSSSFLTTKVISSVVNIRPNNNTIVKNSKTSRKGLDKNIIELQNWINYTYDHHTQINDAHDAIGYIQLSPDTEPIHMFYCSQFLYLPTSVLNEIEIGKISLRKDINIFADIGLQKEINEILFSYELTWLWYGLEAVLLPSESWINEELLSHINEEIVICQNSPRKQKKVIQTLILEQLINNHQIIEKYNKYKPLNEKYEYEMKIELSKHFIIKILHLIYFLDIARHYQATKVLNLFRKDAHIKSSTDALITFCKLCLYGESNIIHHLSSLGYKVTYEQHYTYEYKYHIEHLVIDFSDGIHMAKLVEILTQQVICTYLRVPAVSRLQKIYNITLSLRTLHQMHSSFYNNLYLQSNICTNKSTTMSLSKLRQNTLNRTTSTTTTTTAEVSLYEDEYKRAQWLEEKINNDAKAIVEGNQEILINILQRIRYLFDHKPIISLERVQYENQRIMKGLSILLTQVETSNTLDIQCEEGYDEVYHKLIHWCQLILSYFNTKITNLTYDFNNGYLFLLLIHHYESTLVPYTSIQHPQVDKLLTLDQIQKNYQTLRKVAKVLGKIPMEILPNQLIEHPQWDILNLLYLLSHIFNRMMISLRHTSARKIQGMFRMKYAYKWKKNVVRTSIRNVRCLQSPMVSIYVPHDKYQSASNTLLLKESVVPSPYQPEKSDDEYFENTVMPSLYPDINTTDTYIQDVPSFNKNNSSQLLKTYDLLCQTPVINRIESLDDDSDDEDMINRHTHTEIDDNDDILNYIHSRIPSYDKEELNQNDLLELSSVLQQKQQSSSTSLIKKSSHKRSRVLTPYDSNKIMTLPISANKLDSADSTNPLSVLRKNLKRSGMKSMIKDFSNTLTSTIYDTSLIHTPYDYDKENEYHHMYVNMASVDVDTPLISSKISDSYMYTHSVSKTAKSTDSQQNCTSLMSGIKGSPKHPSYDILKQDLEDEYKKILDKKLYETRESIEISLRTQFESQSSELEEKLHYERLARLTAETQIQMETERRIYLEEKLRCLEEEKVEAERRQQEDKEYKERQYLLQQWATQYISVWIYTQLNRMKYTRSINCIPKVQALYRAYIVRKNLRMLHAAANKIQTVWRKKRTHLHIQLLQQASKRIQQAYKSYCTKKYILQLIATVTRIQSWYRSCTIRNTYIKTRQYVIMLQNHTRKLLSKRQSFVQERACVHIQSLYRGFRTRQLYTQMSHARKLIQNTILSYVLRTRNHHHQLTLQRQQFIERLHYLKSRSIIRRTIKNWIYHQRRVKAVSKIERLFIAYLPYIRVKKMTKGFNRLQALYRAYSLRKTQSTDFSDLRHKIYISALSAEKSPHLRLYPRIVTILQELEKKLSSLPIDILMKHATIMHMGTQYSKKCCEIFTHKKYLLPVLAMMKMCTRSTTHQQLLSLSLAVFFNLNRYPDIMSKIAHIHESVDTLVDILQMFRDIRSISTLTIHILIQILSSNQKTFQEIRQGRKEHRKRLEGIYHIIDRKYRLDTRVKLLHTTTTTTTNVTTAATNYNNDSCSSNSTNTNVMSGSPTEIAEKVSVEDGNKGIHSSVLYNELKGLLPIHIVQYIVNYCKYWNEDASLLYMKDVLTMLK